MSKLYFRYGAMGSGKSTILMQVAFNYESRGMNVLVIKPGIDTKGGNCLVSRIGIKRDVDILLKEKDSVIDKIDFKKKIHCILVDESQFLTESQVFDLFVIAKEYNIPVICYGLRTNFKGKLFVGTKRLLELADELEELVTVCKCGKKAKFNVRKQNNKYLTDGNDVLIDGTSEVEYVSLCGKCYLEEVQKIMLEQ